MRDLKNIFILIIAPEKVFHINISFFRHDKKGNFMVGFNFFELRDIRRNILNYKENIVSFLEIRAF